MCLFVCFVLFCFVFVFVFSYVRDNPPALSLPSFFISFLCTVCHTGTNILVQDFSLISNHALVDIFLSSHHLDFMNLLMMCREIPLLSLLGTKGLSVYTDKLPNRTSRQLVWMLGSYLFWCI